MFKNIKSFIKKHIKGILLVLSIIVIALYQIDTSNELKSVTYSEFSQAVREHKIADLRIYDGYSKMSKVAYATKDDMKVAEKDRVYKTTLVPSFQTFFDKFISDSANQNVKTDGKPIEEPSFFIVFIKGFFNILLFLGIAIYLQMKMSGGMSVLSKSNFTELSPEKIDVTFDDVIGIDEIKKEVNEIVDFLNKPKEFTKAGAKMPKGAILSGSPGTGKTMLAKALAKESGVPFFYVSGSSFQEMFVGLGASRVRQLFAKAKISAPCIIFIDEIDSIGGKRSSAHRGFSNSEQESTLNELLVQMDGMETQAGIFVMGATNRVELLDKALLRPGRLDRSLVLHYPNMDGRLELIKKLSTSYTLDEYYTKDEKGFKELARSFSGMSPAEITNLFNEAAIYQVRKNKASIDKECFNEATDKIIMGMGNGAKMNDEDKRITAYHEAGHAVVGLLLDKCDPVHKVTITPRGNALGVTMTLPTEDRVNHSVSYLKAQISMLYGGFCAEQIFIGDNTTGASNDIERATAIAKSMVTRWGMSPRLQQYVYVSEDGFGGENLNMVSEQTKIIIDEEIKSILKTQYSVTTSLLSENRDVVEAIVERLLDKEVIDQSDIVEILTKLNKPIPKELQ